MQLYEKSQLETIETYMRLHELAKEVIASGVSAAKYGEVDIDAAAMCLVGTMESLVGGRACLGIKYDTGKISAALVDLLTRGLLI